METWITVDPTPTTPAEILTHGITFGVRDTNTGVTWTHKYTSITGGDKKTHSYESYFSGKDSEAIDERLQSGGKPIGPLAYYGTTPWVSTSVTTFDGQSHPIRGGSHDEILMKENGYTLSAPGYNEPGEFTDYYLQCSGVDAGIAPGRR